MSLLVLVFLLLAHQRVTPPVVEGVFEGRTPCGPIANAFTGFPVERCEKIKWELTLRADGADTGTYEYRGTRTSHRGTWRVQRGTGPAKGWTVIRLGSDDQSRTLALLRIDQNVLHLLDPDLKVLVGDASWSYALNRTDRRR